MLSNPMINFYRRAGDAAELNGHPTLAHAAYLAASQLESGFEIGTVQRPAKFKARPGFVGQEGMPGMGTMPSTQHYPTPGNLQVNQPTHYQTSVPAGQGGSPIPVPTPTPRPNVPPSGPPYPCPAGFDPYAWDFHRGCPLDTCNDMSTGVTLNCDTPTLCNHNLIGQNTLGTAGIPSGANGRIVVTAGDAGSFKPHFFYYEALPFASEQTVDIAVLPPSHELAPVLLQDVFVGRNSQLRRGGSPDTAIPQGAFAKNKPVTRVDWARFTSTQEQNWSGIFYNPNAAFAIHVFVAMWGDI